MASKTKKEVVKSMAGMGLGVGLAKLAARAGGGLISGALSTASSVMFSSAAFRAANTVTDVIVDKITGESKKIRVAEKDEDQ